MFKFTTTVLVLLLGIFVVCSLAESRRDDKLFKKFPLHDALKQVYTEHATAAAGNSNAKLIDFSTIVQQVAQAEEKKHVEKIARALEKQATNAADDSSDLATVAKEQPLSYSVFHNYDSEAIVLYGKADLKILRALLKDENYKPIALGNSEFGVVAIWIINHKDTSIGAFKQLFVTAMVASKNLGYTLGVTYKEGNEASILFPAFGKLPEHARFFVINSAADNVASKSFSEKVNMIPTAMMRTHASDFKFSHDMPLITSSMSVGNSKTGSEETPVATETSKFTTFKFVDDKNDLIIEGKIKEDNSWKSWFSTSYDILRSLGLSGIIDLWYAKHVPAKLVTSAKAPAAKWTTFNMDMKQSFHAATSGENFELVVGERNEIGRKLRALKFQPSMLVRMPLLQYAQMMPKDQTEDNEFNTPQEDLRWEDEEKVKQALKQQQA